MGWREALVAHRERIGALVDAAPPLTAEQRDRLAAIIAGTAQPIRRDTTDTAND